MLNHSLLWLWTTTWQSTVLAFLVFVVIHLFRNRLQPRWQYLLWSIVLVRLAMPILPSTPWGFWGDDAEVQVKTAQLPPPETFLNGDDTDVATEDSSTLAPVPESTEGLTDQALVASPEVVDDSTEPDQAKEAVTWQTYATKSFFIIWLCGVTCLLARQLTGEYRLWRMRRCWKRVEDPEILKQFETCRQKAGVRFSVGLYSIPDALGAGSCGWLQPSVLLSEATLAQLSSDQLKLVLMHELLHHRRRDPLQQRIGLWLSVIHWFNPVMWLTLRQLGKYRETACDAAVLDRLGQCHQKEYGQVVLDFATGLAADRPIPGLVGVFHKNGIKKRIEMIVHHKKTRWYHLALGTSLLLLVTMFGLTKADRASSPTLEESETITSEEVASPTPLKADLPGGGSVEFLELRYCDPSEEKKTKVSKEHWSPNGISLGLKKTDGMSMKTLQWPQGYTPILCAFQFRNMTPDWSYYSHEFEHRSPKKISKGCNSPSFMVTAFPEDKKQLNRIHFHCPKSDWQTISSEHVRYLSPQDTSTEKERIITDPEHGLKKLNLRLSTEETWFVSGPSIFCSHTSSGRDIYDVNGQLCIPNEMVRESKFSCQQTRLVFMDKEGKEYISKRVGGSSLTKVNRCLYSVSFHGKDAEAKAKSIESIRLEVRPYRIVEFKNIALYPGHKTKPEVKVLPGLFPKVPLETKESDKVHQDKDALLDGLLSRNTLIRTGIFVYKHASMVLEDYGNGQPWLWEEGKTPYTRELTVAGDEWVLRWPTSPIVSMHRNDFSSTYTETPQPDGKETYRSLILTGPEGVHKSLEEEGKGNRHFCITKAGSVPSAKITNFMEKNRDRIKHIGEKTLHGIETQILQMRLDWKEFSKILPSDHPVFLKQDTMLMTFYVAPTRNYAAVRIEYSTPDGFMAKRYECTDFTEVATGIFFPKCYCDISNFSQAGNGYYIHQYLMSDLTNVNKPVPESSFEMEVPKGTRVRDSRPGQDEKTFYTDKAISFSTADELFHKAAAPAPSKSPFKEYVTKTYSVKDLINPLPGVTVAPHYRVIPTREEMHKIVTTSCSLDSTDLKKKIANSLIHSLRYSTYKPHSSPWNVRTGPKPSIKFVPENDSLEITHDEAMHKTLEKRLESIRGQGTKQIATVTLHFTDLSPEKAGIEKADLKFNSHRSQLSTEAVKQYRQKCKDEKRLWKSLAPITLQLGQGCTIIDTALEEFLTPAGQIGAWPCICVTTPYKPSKEKETKNLSFGISDYPEQEAIPGFMDATSIKAEKGNALLCDVSELFSKHAKKPGLYLLVEVTWDEVKSKNSVSSQ